MKVAYFSPLPPERSGIADYSALLLPALMERMDVEVVKHGAKRAPRGTDVSLYHVGNLADAHGWIVDALRREPGVVVLLDYVLHHLVAGITLGRGDRSGYLDAMQVEAGAIGRMLAHGVVDGLVPPIWEERPHDYPLSASVVALSTGVIAHSRYVEERVRRTFAGPVWRVPHPAWPPPADLRRLSLPRNGSPLVVSVGNVNPSKRVPQLLAAFALLRRSHPEALLVLAGAVAPSFDLTGEIDRSGLEAGRDVVHLDYVEEQALWGLLAAGDVCVSLRHPTMGETSGIAVRALSAGHPLVVSDVGWFAELPDEVALKVPVGKDEVATLAAELELLAGDSARRKRMGAAAAEYARTEHALDRSADLYLAALEEAAGGPAVENAVVGEFAHAAEQVGLDSQSAGLSHLADALRSLRRGD